MSEPNIQKVETDGDRSLPIFREFEEVAERIRQRAYELFADRGFRFGSDLDDWLAAEREVCWPAAELTEEDDEFEIKIALAGFEAEDITVTATPREVIVKAVQERKEEGDDDEQVRWSEFHKSDVYRRIELPQAVNVDGIKAKLKKGILEIDVPKAEFPAVESKKIEIEGDG